MISFDKEQQKIAFVLFVVGIIAAAALGVVDEITKEPIARAQRDALNKSLVQVLPEHQNQPYAESFDMLIDSNPEPIHFYPAADEKGNVIAYAWQQIAPDGYSGTIRILMGVRTNGEIVAIRIIDHRETPGLGDGIVHNQAWLQSFLQKTLANARWAVKKDGGDFDQFTGATITPRAVVKAVQKGLKMFAAQQSMLLQTYQRQQQAAMRADEQQAMQVGG